MSSPSLSPAGENALAGIAHRHGFSPDAARAMVASLFRGGGGMAQFNHPEFGGMGQWSQGGMIMIGDMFNNGLKARVSALAEDLAFAMGQGTIVEVRPAAGFGGFGGFSGADWWPEGLGVPSSSGGQNTSRYAVFPATRRLAVEVDGIVTVYDTGDHQIGGVSQQQGNSQDLVFQSQYGSFRVHDLPRVQPEGQAPVPSPPADAVAYAPPPTNPPLSTFVPPTATPPAAAEATPAPAAAPSGTGSPGDIVAALERLAALKDKGFLSDDEFTTAKRDLLSRL